MWLLSKLSGSLNRLERKGLVQAFIGIDWPHFNIEISRALLSLSGFR
jgi:hypothetical protein